jgi:hypothetical protein
MAIRPGQIFYPADYNNITTYSWNEMRPRIQIEKIKHDYDHKVEYRIKYGDLDVSKSFHPDEVQDIHTMERKVRTDLEIGINEMFQKCKKEAITQLRETFTDTRDFDNTSLNAHTLRQAREQLGQLARNQQEVMMTPVSNNTFSTWDIYNSINLNPKQDKINKKAMSLLKEKIGKAKFKSLEKEGYFEEKGKHGKYRFYKNDPSGVRFIQEIDAGGKKRPLEWTLCIQSSVANMPAGDVILARWMEFKADEEKFRKTANWRNVKTEDEAII